MSSLPKGSHIVVFGGNNDDGSNETLLGVKNWIYHRGSTVVYDGYINLSGLFYDGTMTDGNPNYVAFSGDSSNSNYRK